MKKLFLSLVICLAALFSFAQTPAFYCVGNDLTNTIVAKYPASADITTKVTWVADNKEALLELFKSLDLPNNKLFNINAKGEAVSTVNDKSNIDAKSSQALWLLLMNMKANETSYVQKMIDLLGEPNFIYFNTKTYVHDIQTEQMYQEAKSSGWYIPELGAKVTLSHWCYMIHQKGDVEYLKAKIADGTIPMYNIANTPWLQKYCSDEQLYEYLNNLQDPTEAQEKLKNRIFVKLYQKKMLGK